MSFFWVLKTVYLLWSVSQLLTIPYGLLLHLIAIAIFAWEFISSLLLTVCLLWSVCCLLTVPYDLL